MSTFNMSAELHPSEWAAVWCPLHALTNISKRGKIIVAILKIILLDEIIFNVGTCSKTGIVSTQVIDFNHLYIS